MSISSPYGSPELSEIPSLDEQYEIVRKLLTQGDNFQNICTVEMLPSGQHKIHIESFVFELEGGIITPSARFVPYVLDFIVDSPPVSFHYLKPSKLPSGVDIDFNWQAKIYEDVGRTVLPIARIKPTPGSTFVRPNHLYYNENGPQMGVSEAIIALNIVDGTVTNQNRYYPIDCAWELLSNIANGNPSDPCILRTFDLDNIEKRSEQIVSEITGRVIATQNPLS